MTPRSLDEAVFLTQYLVRGDPPTDEGAGGEGVPIGYHDGASLQNDLCFGLVTYGKPGGGNLTAYGYGYVYNNGVGHGDLYDKDGDGQGFDYRNDAKKSR